MVTAKEFSAWNSPYSDYMALLQQEQNFNLPYFPPQKSTLTANVAFPGQPASDIHGLSRMGYPQWNIPYHTAGPCLKNPHFALPHRLGVPDKLIDAASASQKRFLIFDQSGNDTRLFFSTSFSPENRNIPSEIPVNANKQFLVNPEIKEKWDENHLSDGEGEMVEDSEEINALLYSDSDDEYYDDDDYDDNDDYDNENDEVTSTRHTRSIIEEGNDNDNKSLEEKPLEEVASCDGSPKRQRLVDGRYTKSSSQNSYHDDDIDSSGREKKVKIREALKIMESIIPGLKSKDPLSTIEKAILYLESMKAEAEALGLSFPEGKSVISP